MRAGGRPLVLSRDISQHARVSARQASAYPRTSAPHRLDEGAGPCAPAGDHAERLGDGGVDLRNSTTTQQQILSARAGSLVYAAAS